MAKITNKIVDLIDGINQYLIIANEARRLSQTGTIRKKRGLP
jgi:hypothetical protein